MTFRSKLEERVSKLLGSEWGYETTQVDYTLYKTYLADFANEKTIVEVKGFFRPGDQAKYLAVRDACKADGFDFVFVLSHPDKPVRRKAKLTMSLWCEKHNIPWYKAEDADKIL